MKLFVVFFTFLAVQGWAAAGVIHDELVELDDLEGFEDVRTLDDQYEELGALEMFDASKADPNKCLPHIQDAYKIAVEIRRIVTEGAALKKKVQEALKKCKSLPKPEEQNKCAQEALKSVKSQKEALLKAWNAVKPKAVDMMDKFKKCLA